MRRKLCKKDIDLAKVGLIALVDEATGYQYARPDDELRRKYEELTKVEDDKEGVSNENPNL